MRRPRAKSRRRRDDWRVGGCEVHRWDFRVLMVAVSCAGLGMVGAGTAGWLSGSRTSLSPTAALWGGLTAAVLFAFVRGRPAGLLRWKGVDLLWGISLGLILRLIAGALTSADSLIFPSADGPGGVSTLPWWSIHALPAVLVGPLVEEFFFRAVLLVVLYQLLRRAVGVRAGGTIALFFTMAAFLVLHALFSPLAVVDGFLLLLVALTCGLLVLLTGRIWPAVLTHMVYNVCYIALVLIGSVLT